MGCADPTYFDGFVFQLQFVKALIAPGFCALDLINDRTNDVIIDISIRTIRQGFIHAKYPDRV